MADFGYNNDVEDFETSVYPLKHFPARPGKAWPQKFRLMTFNCFGINKPRFAYTRLEFRLSELIKEIHRQAPVAVAFQELSPWVMGFLSEHLTGYQSVEPPREFEECKQRDQVSVGWFVAEGYGYESSILYQLKGEQLYTMMNLRVEGVELVNVHLQAGSKFSKGVRRGADKYHTSRVEMMKRIWDEFSSLCPMVFCGDTNFDHEGTPEDWPALEVFRLWGLHDLWSEFHPTEPGFTEDTKINSMRWNFKQQERQVRFDVMATQRLEEKWKAQNIELVGREPIGRFPAEDLLKYQEILHLDPEEMRTVEGADGKPMLEWFLSDHFGLITEFEKAKKPEEISE